MNETVDHAKQQAQAQLESIIEMVTALNDARDAQEDGLEGSDEVEEQAQQAILEDPLSVEVRTDWYTPHGQETMDNKPLEYRILLCTGGPAVQIVGELSEHLEPETARIEYQDWGTPWTDYPLTSEQEGYVLEYAQQFYYGEG